LAVYSYAQNNDDIEPTYFGSEDEKPNPSWKPTQPELAQVRRILRGEG
jgi:hypothetical protein